MHLCYLGKKLNCKHQAQLEFAAHHSQTPHLIQVPRECREFRVQDDYYRWAI